MTEQINTQEFSNDVITYGRELVVHINDRSITVKKLGLITYSKMAQSLRGLIESVVALFQSDDILRSLENMESYSEEKETADAKTNAFAEILAKIVDKNIQQVIALLDIAVPELGREYIENEVGLDDTLVLLDAIIKVNNINKVVNDGKKFLQNLMGNQNQY